ncbi:MAG TPA: beta-ketoacyl-[acyl-carrier-protein] synthase family protein [Labilithrix sp.]
MSPRTRVVITGYGAVCSLGDDAAAIWSAIAEKKVGYRVCGFGDDRIKAKFFGVIDSEGLARRYKEFPRGLMRMVAEFAKYTLVASKEAVSMAFGGNAIESAYAPNECGAIIGTGWGGLDSGNKNNDEYKKTKFSTPFATIMSMHNSASAALSMHYGLRGYQNTHVAACASGAIAIGEAAEVIRRGQAKLMIAGGSESLREVFNVWAIDVMEALSKETADVRKACCPFSLDRSGFVLSEGAAVVVLEEMESAIARGAPILAEVTGYANYSDAHDFTAPAPDGQGRLNVIAGALRSARRAPAEIDYVNAHGTSTPLNDFYESEAIKAVLGDHARRVPISSTKSYTGHLIGAAGALETIFCVKAIETGLIPATIHHDRADPKCDLDYVPNEHRTGAKVDRCLKLSFGFGGANAALVIERVAS